MTESSNDEDKDDPELNISLSDLATLSISSCLDEIIALQPLSDRSVAQPCSQRPAAEKQSSTQGQGEGQQAYEQTAGAQRDENARAEPSHVRESRAKVEVSAIRGELHVRRAGRGYLGRCAKQSPQLDVAQSCEALRAFRPIGARGMRPSLSPLHGHGHAHVERNEQRYMTISKMADILYMAVTSCSLSCRGESLRMCGTRGTCEYRPGAGVAFAPRSVTQVLCPMYI